MRVYNIDSVKGFLERYKYHFFIVLVAVVGYWQVALMRYTLKWDDIDQYLPWRYFVSECLRNGVLPFWNPYQHWGYAMHADPQSGVWYPVVWIISLLHGYDVYANQFDFMLHIVLAGIGMFLLMNRFVNDRRVAFLIGCSYMLSGFFVGNAQHLTYMVSGAWIPFVLFYYGLTPSPSPKERGVARATEWRNTIACALCFFMMTTGGYPAFTIVVAYSLVVIFVVKVILEYRRKNIEAVKRFAGFNVLFFVISILLCSGVLLSQWIAKEYIVRSSKLPLDVVNFNPFSPQSLISLVLPLASAKNPQLLDTDISMSNLYFGVVMLSVFIVALFRKKTRFEKIVLFMGLFFLLAAFGKYTPVRAMLYYTVPLMNLFRFPSIFRLFALICFLIVAGFGLKDLLNGNNARTLKRVIGILAGVCLAVVVVYFFNARLRLPSFSFFNYFLNGLNFKESILLQGIIALIVFIALLIVIRKNTVKYSLIVMIILIDLIVAAQLNIPATVIYDTKTAGLSNQLKRIPKGFPVPQNIAAENYCDKTVHIASLWRNMNLWNKQPAYDGFNSFKMKGYYQMADEAQVMLPLLKDNIAFFSLGYSFYNDTIHDYDVLQKNPTHLFFNERDKNKIVETYVTDTVDKAIFEKFNPDDIVVSTFTDTPRYLTLMQHNYPLWQVTIDGKPTEHITSDYLFMSTLVPAGNHTVEFKFNNKALKIAWIISIITTLVCIVILLFAGFRKRSSGIPPERVLLL
jgi:hypothetical protein